MKTKKHSALAAIAVLGGALALVQSLTSCTGSCEDKGSCGDYIPPGGSASEAGASSGSAGGGKAGNTQGGSSSGAAGGPTGGVGEGGAGAAAGEGGMGGMGGSVTQPCDGKCMAPTPVCDEPNDACVECLKEADCTSGIKTKCDASNACVECLVPTDCASATAAKCDGAGACVKCVSNADCAHIVGKTTCDTVAGECVQCTGKDYAACGARDGTSLVCDSLTRTCTDQKERSAVECLPCASDAQCTLGQLCVKQQYGVPTKQNVGYFCFWQQGAAAGGAPTDCTVLENRPYVAPFVNQTSIDGEMATVCGLGESTCIARNQFKSKDCVTASAADDQKCGFAPGKDSKCLAFGASQFRCSMACTSIDDCPGSLGCGANSFCNVQP